MSDEAQKRGRRTLFGMPMTPAERQRRHRCIARARKCAGMSPTVAALVSQSIPRTRTKIETLPAEADAKRTVLHSRLSAARGHLFA
jgi:hypothetical protein